MPVSKQYLSKKAGKAPSELLDVAISSNSFPFSKAAILARVLPMSMTKFKFSFFLRVQSYDFLNLFHVFFLLKTIFSDTI
jgi:hypothetical protein